MSSEDDDRSTETDTETNGTPASGKTPDSPAFSPDDPQVTPLGGNAGVHIQPDDEDDDLEDEDPEDDFDDLSVDFGGFVVSLGTSCMVNLGQHANPETGELAQKDLPAARQTIDILEMLKRKTRGNLSDDERQLLDNLLQDLRQAYREASE